MAKELGFANRRTVALTKSATRARLADSLLLKRLGYEDDGKTIHAYLSRQDIAGFLHDHLQRNKNSLKFCH